MGKYIFLNRRIQISKKSGCRNVTAILSQAFIQSFMGVVFCNFLACTHEKPHFTYMPDMAYSPAWKAQKGEMRVPVAGTIPRDFFPYAYAKNPELAGKELKNPMSRPTSQLLIRGQTLFNAYCMVCHGPAGEGNGSIVPKFPRPPSLQSKKVRTWPDGRLYHAITMGQNLMPSYASQIKVVDRWAIVHYIRVLQRSKHPPTAEDLHGVEN